MPIISYAKVLKWNEVKHPRDAHGQFTATGGASTEDRHLSQDAVTIYQHVAAESYHAGVMDELDPDLSDQHSLAHAAHEVAMRAHADVVKYSKPRQVGPSYADPAMSERANEASYTANNITAKLKRKGYSRAPD